MPIFSTLSCSYEETQALNARDRGPENGAQDVCKITRVEYVYSATSRVSTTAPGTRGVKCPGHRLQLYCSSKFRSRGYFLARSLPYSM